MESDHPIEDKSFQSRLIYNIKVASAIGSASLKVAGDQVEIKHTGNAWAVVLDPAENVKKNLNYLSQIIGTKNIFKPDPFPQGLSKTVEKDIIFLIVVPNVEYEPLKVKPNDMITSLLSFDGTDERLAIESFNSFIMEFIKDQLIFLALGRIVNSPMPEPHALVHAAVPSSFDLSNAMKMLTIKPTCPYALGNFVFWNFQNIIAANVGQQINQLAFATADGISSAGVELSIEDQGNNIKKDKCSNRPS